MPHPTAGGYWTLAQVRLPEDEELLRVPEAVDASKDYEPGSPQEELNRVQNVLAGEYMEVEDELR